MTDFDRLGSQVEHLRVFERQLPERVGAAFIRDFISGVYDRHAATMLPMPASCNDVAQDARDRLLAGDFMSNEKYLLRVLKQPLGKKNLDHLLSNNVLYFDKLALAQRVPLLRDVVLLLALGTAAGLFLFELIVVLAPRSHGDSY